MSRRESAGARSGTVVRGTPGGKGRRSGQRRAQGGGRPRSGRPEIDTGNHRRVPSAPELAPTPSVVEWGTVSPVGYVGAWAFCATTRFDAFTGRAAFFTGWKLGAALLGAKPAVAKGSRYLGTLSSLLASETLNQPALASTAKRSDRTMITASPIITVTIQQIQPTIA